MENVQFFQGLIHLIFWNVTHFLVFPRSYQNKHVQWTLSNLHCVLLWLEDVMLGAKILPYSTIQKLPNCMYTIPTPHSNWWGIYSMVVLFYQSKDYIVSFRFIRSINSNIIWLEITKMILLAGKKKMLQTMIINHKQSRSKDFCDNEFVCVCPLRFNDSKFIISMA